LGDKVVGQLLMIYMWKIPESYKNRDIGQYDRDCSPNSFLLKRGRCLAADEFSPMPTVNFIVPKQRLLKLDCLANDTLVPLVNQRIKRVLPASACSEYFVRI
jgi:hypothetical protein